MAGCQVAYYLVHSLADADFERKDAAAAAAFGQAGARAGLQRIIYLGGLGDARNPLDLPDAPNDDRGEAQHSATGRTGSQACA